MEAIKCGGWTVNENMKECDLPKSVEIAFRKATDVLLGAKYMPVLFIGSQVVAGTNYMLICKQTLILAESIEHVVKMGIYVNLDFEAVVTSIETII